MERTFSVNDGLDYSGDASVGSFFSSDFKKNDDLKQMLDSNRDNLKLEAMKRIIGMVAKGRDASDLFPAVVKNVVSKNTEVKKLVYVYLMRYAEEQQDLALLSISTFQRALKDPNQLIRGSALRVLSSIRVSVIVPIVMLAIRDASADMSPYVRKTAAHAVPKLYSLDPEQKDELIQILDKLLADKTTLVVGSAVMAFEEVCPERSDMIHKNFRKLCALLVDVDEWGQVVILNMLTRYARSQFVDPNIGDLSMDGEDKPFYDDEEHEDEDEHAKSAREAAKNRPQMDPDHRLLLKNSRPLLQSRNASVVMAVVQLYHHCAPKTEVPLVVKALIRLLRSHVEVQAVVLTCIAAMSTDRKSLFEPYMKSFFVRSSDPTQIKLLKLEILTNIANETNIPPILREFQTYISSQDKVFVAATIQAIGRCASNIKEVAETCLNGLVSLLSHRDPAVVGGAVVVAKTLLQSQRSGNKPVIAQLAKMVDRVTVAPARAAILWLLGEHCERLPTLPPDVLRKMAKTFADEEDIVKLQIINLAAKLQITNPSQTTLLCQYILNLAKYDQSYDIRDRARFLRHLLFPENPDAVKLPKLAKRILLSSKPAPVLQSKFKDRDHFQLGSLSHFLNTRANGYQDLPGYPEVAPDSSVRNVEPPPSAKYEENLFMDIDSSSKKKGKQSSKKKSFYSDGSDSNGSGGDDDDGSDEESGSGSSSGSGTEDSESDSGSGSGSSSSCCSEPGSSDEEAKAPKNPRASNKIKPIADTKLNDRKVVRYSEDLDDESSSGGSGDDDDGKSSSGHSKSSSATSSSAGSSSSSESEEEEDGPKRKTKSKNGKSAKVLTKTSSSPAPNSQSQSQTKVKPVKGATAPPAQDPGMSNKAGSKKGKPGKEKKVEELLLDLDLSGEPSNGAENQSTSSSAAMMSSLGGILAPTVGHEASGTTTTTALSSSLASLSSLESSSAMYTPSKTTELVNKIQSGGLHIMSRFTRSPHLESSSLISLELTISNVSSKETFKQIRVGSKTLASGMSVHDFEPIELLEPGKVMVVTLGIDFNDTTQGAKMEIVWGTEREPTKKHTVTITAPIGELIRAVTMSEAQFIAQQGKLRGMNEHETKTLVNPALGDSSNTTRLVQRVYETANLLQVPSTQDDLVRFAGQTVSGKAVVLVTVSFQGKDSSSSDSDGKNMARILVNSEKMVIASMLVQELKEALK